MVKSVRILVVGDPGTGKSSIINSLATEKYKADVPNVLPVMRIQDNSLEKVSIAVVDTSGSANDQELAPEFKRADALVIVWDACRTETLESVRSRWLPLLRASSSGGPEDYAKQTPVVLVGNKVDVRDGDGGDHQQLQEEMVQNKIVPLMNDFSEIETCIECSAKLVFNIPEVFIFAQKAVLHPTAPLWDIREHRLRPACEKALKRIFLLCDNDKDNALNDKELNDFQLTCFNQPLKPDEVVGVKEVVRNSTPDGINERGLTLSGFLFLHTLFIHKGRVETTWAVLRKFGYDDNLSYTPEANHVTVKRKRLDAVTELAEEGIKFLTEVFNRYDIDRDGALNARELDEMWADTPGNLWGSLSDIGASVPTNAAGNLTENGFIARWTMTTVADPEKTLQYFLYLAYPGDPRKCIRTIRKDVTNGDLPKHKRRNVFNCYVFGATGAGKSSFLDAFIGRQFGSTAPTATQHRRIACNLVPLSANETDDGPSRKVFLLLHEIEGAEQDLILSQSPTEQERLIDLAVMLYDPSSFDYVTRLHLKLSKEIHRVFIASKADLSAETEAPQPSQESPAAYCMKYSLPNPEEWSIRDHEQDVQRLFSMLVQVTLSQDVGKPVGHEFAKQTKGLIPSNPLVVTALGVGFVVILSMYAVRYYRNRLM